MITYDILNMYPYIIAAVTLVILLGALVYYYLRNKKEEPKAQASPGPSPKQAFRPTPPNPQLIGYDGDLIIDRETWRPTVLDGCGRTSSDPMYGYPLCGSIGSIGSIIDGAYNRT